ncbi:MAG TPA: tRNA lysidine(34) synthetase TilS [Nocardioidaceae bacterium]|nr:tRNA lysidine(34) synthetase TilS [Nocardioidaceae bacterium]
MNAPRGRLHPAVADVRRMVRRGLDDLGPDQTVLVACSGGPDSTALALGAAFESRHAGWRVVAVVVDHGLQPGSDRVATQVAQLLRGRGLAPVDVVAVAVDQRGEGLEAAARRARYAALDEAAHRHAADVVLLGHTLDDQAETVLLGLARGSGARSLAGMAERSGRYRRPLLSLTRDTTRAACAAEGAPVWEDPHNHDDRFARVRVRHDVLPVLESALGPGCAQALARTARLLRDDADALDALAAEAERECRRVDGDGLDVSALVVLPPALRRRVLRSAALAAGSPATALFAVHVDALDELVTRWHGQQGIDLPGGVCARRCGGTLRLAPSAVRG